MSIKAVAVIGQSYGEIQGLRNRIGRATAHRSGIVVRRAFTPYRDGMRTVAVPEVLPETITRSRELVASVLAESHVEMGAEGPTALAWEWG
jgi:hypothetical protein